MIVEEEMPLRCLFFFCLFTHIPFVKTKQEETNMGWTGYYITGKVNRKVECDKILNCEHLKVEKSRLEGSTYYAAVRVVKKEVKKENNQYIFEEIPQEEQKVFGVVILTSTKKDRQDAEFCYKEMSECVGPYPRRCPDSILNLLTETDDKYALEWRKDCREYNQKKKFLKNAALGARIEVSLRDDLVIFQKVKTGRHIQWLNEDLQYYSGSVVKTKI